jgi:site-specific recombinase XerD
MSKKNEVSLNYNAELAKKFEKASKRKVSITDFMTDFIGQFISEQTQKAYLTDLRFFFEFMKSGNVIITHPNQIEGHHFQFYRDKLIDDKYSSATINRKLVAIRSFIKWAMASKLIDYNPLDVVKLPSVQTQTPTLAFEDYEVVEMINCADMKTKKGAMNRLAMILLFSLGLRRSELTNIQIMHLYHDRGHNVLKIKGKGDKDRHLPISQIIAEEIKQYIGFLESQGLVLESHDYLLQSSRAGKNEKPMDGSTVYRMIAKYAKECGISKNVSPHSCRATVISHLLDTQKTPIRDVAIFAGHSKITTTERYDKRRESLDNSAAYDVDYTKKKA